MASAVVSKGTPLADLLNKVLAEPSYYAHLPVYATGSSHRLFNSGGSPLGRYRYEVEEEDSSSDSEDDVAVDDHRLARGFSGSMLLSSADLVNPSGAPKTLGRLLSKLKDAAEELSAATAGRGSSLVPLCRGWWVAKKDDDAVTLNVLMPGLAKEQVKVRAEQNTLVIEGEGDKKLADGGGDDDDDHHELRYVRRIKFPADGFKMDQVRAEMKDGLLKVTLPKVKKEERKDVFHVTIE